MDRAEHKTQDARAARRGSPANCPHPATLANISRSWLHWEMRVYLHLCGISRNQTASGIKIANLAADLGANPGTVRMALVALTKCGHIRALARSSIGTVYTLSAPLLLSESFPDAERAPVRAHPPESVSVEHTLRKDERAPGRAGARFQAKNQGSQTPNGKDGRAPGRAGARFQAKTAADQPPNNLTERAPGRAPDGVQSAPGRALADSVSPPHTPPLLVPRSVNLSPPPPGAVQGAREEEEESSTQLPEKDSRSVGMAPNQTDSIKPGSLLPKIPIVNALHDCGFLDDEILRLLQSRPIGSLVAAWHAAHHEAWSGALYCNKPNASRVRACLAENGAKWSADEIRSLLSKLEIGGERIDFPEVLSRLSATLSRECVTVAAREWERRRANAKPGVRPPGIGRLVKFLDSGGATELAMRKKTEAATRAAQEYQNRPLPPPGQTPPGAGKPDALSCELRARCAQFDDDKLRELLEQGLATLPAPDARRVRAQCGQGPADKFRDRCFTYNGSRRVLRLVLDQMEKKE